MISITKNRYSCFKKEIFWWGGGLQLENPSCMVNTPFIEINARNSDLLCNQATTEQTVASRNLIPKGIMAFMSDGNSKTSAHVKSNLCYSICLRCLIRSRTVKNRIFFNRKDHIFVMRAQHVLGYHLT